jgi:hypothetical protein
VSETNVRAPEFAPLDDPPEDNLPEPVELTPEQLVAQAEEEERDRKRRLEWALINRALADNSMAVMRAISQWHPREGESEKHVERVLTSVEDGSFLINRLGAAGVVDQDLAIVLLALRQRLTNDYGSGPAALMLIDRAVVAYQDFFRVSGWIGNLAIMIENEFFGVKGPSANYQDRWGREGPTIRGLTVEQHLRRLREELLPLAERYGRTMCGALAMLETLRAIPSGEVERSQPIKVSVIFGLREP